MIRVDKLPHLPDRFPVVCQWEITCRCNLRCRMCYTDCFNHPDLVRRELTTSEIIHIMDEMAEVGLLELCLTGGEPMARTDFFELYEHAILCGFLVTVFTNGTLISESDADRFAALRPHQIEISLHGTTQETFEQITQGRGSHERCLQAVRLLLDRDIPLVLKTTAMTLNRHEILAIKRYAESLGPVRFKLGEEMRPELDGGMGPFQYGLSDQELTALNRQDKNLWDEACRKQPTDCLPCRSGMQKFHIDAYGQLQLCSGNRTHSYDLRTGSFREGFFTALPTFPCAWNISPTQNTVQSVGHHA
jgi:MoaA/NifB/PqqE/SkfB family radical SAM enzyme